MPDLAAALDQQMARLRRYQGILTDFGRMAADASEVDPLLQLACVQSARGIGIDHSKLMRHRPETGDLLVVAGIGWRPGVVGFVQLGTDVACPAGRAWQTREPVVVDDLPNDREFRYAPVLREHGIVSALNAPIAVNGIVWGVVEVDSAKPRHFGPDDMQFLSALANIVGLALHARMGVKRAAEAEASAARALVQERTLLEELRHRSKNDLQLIMSLLVMQKRKQSEAQAKRGLDHLMDRVAAIGLAHDQLAPGVGAGKVDLAEYLRALCGNLAQRRENVRVEATLALCEMTHERAVPIGLVVNELVTNALKHAFPDGGNGTVAVILEATHEGEGCVRVRDDGVGMGPARPGSLGTELVRRLVQQIGGRVTGEELRQGTGFAIRFPLVA